MEKTIRRKYLPLKPKKEVREVDKLSNLWKEYQKVKKEYPELDYSTFKELRTTIKNNNGSLPDKDRSSLLGQAGHDHKQAWESLYSHIEDNDYNRDDNIKFDTQTRYRVPKWAIDSALNWRPKG